MKFIGIDLAWTYKNETGICIIDEIGTVEYLVSNVFNDEEIVALIDQYSQENLCIAVDAPLIVLNEKGSRTAERTFMRDRIHGHHLSLFVANRSFLIKNYGLIRGEVLADKIMTKCSQVGYSFGPQKGSSVIFETFPSGICAGLFPDIYPVKYKIKKNNPFDKALDDFQRLLAYIEKVEGKNHLTINFSKLIKGPLLTKKDYKHVEDMLDAYLCALTPYTIFKGIADRKTYGCMKEGFITIPLAKEALL